MTQAVKSNLFLYANDSWLVFQEKDVIEIEKQLNRDFKNICQRFLDNRLISILFASKQKIKKVLKLNITII